ncbi:hypothetical protein KSS87_004919 [Heliosperma pusillum]|nr:hypothetical protein KSS87_004919 [Heliosperma pusillum]
MLQAIQEDGINFYHVVDHSLLSLESVTRPGMVLGIGLRENSLGFKAYSSTLSRTCEAIIPTEALNTMIPDMITNGFTQLDWWRYGLGIRGEVSCGVLVVSRRFIDEGILSSRAMFLWLTTI